MEILEVNRSTLANLYEQFPENFKDLKIDGNYLVYGSQTTDISKFNINDLLSGDSAFASALAGLSSEEIFDIIRLHATFLASKEQDLKNKENNNEEKLEVIKKDNPLMQNISIVTKTDGVIKREYFNIVDSNGVDHLFANDRNVDIFAIYETLKIRGNGLVTPDELINEINRKLYRISLDTARLISDSTEVSEDFANKMNAVNDPYRSNKSVNVYGNEQNDIAIIADDHGAKEHEVVTFDKNEFGDLVTERHHQNVTDDGTTTEEVATTTDTDSAEVKEDVEEEVVETLISEEEFYRLLNSDFDLSEDERKSVDLFYAYLGDLVLYEAYLLPELMEMLNRFRAYVYGLQYERDETIELNSKQQEAIDKSNEFELRKNNTELTNDSEKVKEEVQKLQLKYNPSTSDNSGIISSLFVIIAIIIIAIMMMVATFSVIY